MKYNYDIDESTKVIDIIRKSSRKIDDDFIKEIFQKIENEHIKVSTNLVDELLLSVENKELLLKLIANYDGNISLYLTMRLKSLHNDELKIEAIKKCKTRDAMLIIASSLSDDRYKMRVAPYLNDSQITSLSYHIKDDNIKSSLVNEVKNDEEKLYIFRTIGNDKDRIKAIEEYKKGPCDMETLKTMIFSIMNTKLKRKYLEENFDVNFFKNYHDRNYEIFDGGVDALPKDLTFGIEIEAEDGNAELIREYGGKVFNYDVKGDSSLPHGVELTSPVFYYTQKDLKEIYKICEFARANNLKNTKFCGGHIHFGLQYLSNIDSYLWLYYLYTNMEKALYLMSNRKGVLPREAYKDFAKPITNKFKRYLNNKNKDSIKALREYLSSPNNSLSIYYVDYYGEMEDKLPIDTIEIRTPNCQIQGENENIDDYGARDIILDILLFGNLIVKSNKLSNLPMTKELDMLINTFDKANEEEKVDIFLKLLFKEPNLRKIFKQRYLVNNKLYKEENLVNGNIKLRRLIHKWETKS